MFRLDRCSFVILVGGLAVPLLSASCQGERSYENSENGGEAGSASSGGRGLGGEASGGASSGGASSGGDAPTGGAETGGADGSGGDEGTGGAATTPIYVACGDVDECPVHDGGKCCYRETEDDHVCQSTSATCQTTGSGPYVVQRAFTCDEPGDCAPGQFCCYTQAAAGPQGGAACADVCEPPVSSPRYRVCNPANAAPSDCLSGACTGDLTQIPGLHYCQ